MLPGEPQEVSVFLALCCTLYANTTCKQFLKLPTLFKARVTVEPEGDGTYINRAPVRRSASYNVLLVAHGGGIFDLCLAARDMSGEDVAQSSLGTPARRVWSATVSQEHDYAYLPSSLSSFGGYAVTNVTSSRRGLTSHGKVFASLYCNM